MTAIQDIELREVPIPSPLFPNDKYVVIHNKNIAQGIVATVVVKGTAQQDVFDISLRQSGLFPHSQEIRIEAGGFHYIGRSIFPKRTTVDNNTPPTLIDVSYATTGARYIADEPTPLPSAGDAADALRFYKLDFQNGPILDSLIYAINLNHAFGLEAAVSFNKGGGAVDYMFINLTPFEQKLNAQEPMTGVTGLTIHSVRWFTVQAPISAGFIARGWK